MSAIQLGSIELPPDLQWQDEYDWTALAQSEDYTLTGALVIQSQSRQAGRPITLAGEWAWVTKATVETLRAMADSEQAYALTLADGRAFTVRFRENGMTAQPVRFLGDQDDDDPYAVELRLLAV